MGRRFKNPLWRHKLLLAFETDRDRYKLARSRIKLTSTHRGEARYNGQTLMVSLAKSGWVTIKGYGRVHPLVLGKL